MTSMANEPPQVRPSSDTHLAEVVSVQNVHEAGRIEVRLLSYDGPDTQDAIIEARLCVPFAGADRGAFFVPDVGDEVVVGFIGGDPRQAVILGGVWNGRNQPKEQLGGDRVDRWSFIGKSGTRIAIVEEGSGAKIELSTVSGGSPISSITIDRDGGGEIELRAGATTLTLSPDGIRLQTSGNFELSASTASATCSSLSVNAGTSSFSGHVSAACVQSPAIVGNTYTPGAGNVW